jgi:hypothetical protein
VEKTSSKSPVCDTSPALASKTGGGTGGGGSKAFASLYFLASLYSYFSLKTLVLTLGLNLGITTSAASSVSSSSASSVLLVLASAVSLKVVDSVSVSLVVEFPSSVELVSLASGSSVISTSTANSSSASRLTPFPSMEA